jgi:hypothetical protein
MRPTRHIELTKKNESSASSSTRPVTDVHAKATIESNMKRISQLASAYAGMTMDSEDEVSEFKLGEEENFYENLGQCNAFFAYASHESSNHSDDDTSSDDKPTAICLMAKAS